MILPFLTEMQWMPKRILLLKEALPEATNVADLAFRSVSLWLPWASIANIEPIVNLEEAFGKKDLSQIDMSLPELRSRLTIYGVGGKPLHR